MLENRILWGGVCVLVLMMSCASKPQVYKKPDFQLQNQKIFIVPFDNMTNYSKAGHIVSNLMEAEFRIQGVRPAEHREGAHFLLTGTVTEFRYRKGFSENPAIGFTAKLMSTESKEIVWTITLSDHSEPFVTSALTLNELAQKMVRTALESMR